MAARRLAMLTGVGSDHVLYRTVPLCYCGARAVAAKHHLRHRIPCVYRGGLASPPARAASWHGRARPRGAEPSLPESPQAMRRSVPCRFAAESCMPRLRSTTSAMGTIPPYEPYTAMPQGSPPGPRGGSIGVPDRSSGQPQARRVRSDSPATSPARGAAQGGRIQ